MVQSEEGTKHWADTFPYVDVLLLHAGPFGMLDDPSDKIHLGNLDVKRYVLEKQPKFVFVGHQYSDDQMETKGIKLYRTYGARIIEVSI